MKNDYPRFMFFWGHKKLEEKYYCGGLGFIPSLRATLSDAAVPSAAAESTGRAIPSDADASSAAAAAAGSTTESSTSESTTTHVPATQRPQSSTGRATPPDADAGSLTSYYDYECGAIRGFSHLMVAAVISTKTRRGFDLLTNVIKSKGW
ncbi:hypothetical protein BDD12DRAFT_807719 [Trichophaea hybrida]|nr:hypothetical protein BDD12DRAFT_807719 [Trichophaea hybrida]